MPSKKSFRTSHYIHTHSREEKIIVPQDQTESDIKKLLPYKDTDVNTLNLELDEAYKRIVKKSFSDDMDVRKNLAAIISKYMNADENVRSFTVGAYLLAAMNSPTLCPSCNPLTSNMIHEKCQNNIFWLKRNPKGKLEIKCTTKMDQNKKNYIFLQSNPTDTKDFYKLLSQNGIKSYTPIIPSSDGNRIINVGPEVNVEEPVVNVVNNATPTVISSQAERPVAFVQEPKSRNWILVSLIVFILLLILIYLLS